MLIARLDPFAQFVRQTHQRIKGVNLYSFAVENVKKLVPVEVENEFSSQQAIAAFLRSKMSLQHVQQAIEEAGSIFWKLRAENVELKEIVKLQEIQIELLKDKLSLLDNE